MFGKITYSKTNKKNKLYEYEKELKRVTETCNKASPQNMPFCERSLKKKPKCDEVAVIWWLIDVYEETQDGIDTIAANSLIYHQDKGIGL